MMRTSLRRGINRFSAFLGLVGGAGMCLAFHLWSGQKPGPLSFLPADMLVGGAGLAVTMVMAMNVDMDRVNKVRDYAWFFAGYFSAWAGIGALIGTLFGGWLKGLEGAVYLPIAVAVLMVILGSFLGVVFGSGYGIYRLYQRRGRPIWPESVRSPLRRMFTDKEEGETGERKA